MDETNLRESTKSVEPRSADFSGETPRYPMDGNSNCTTWCRWETYRAFRNGQPGWDCRFIINATKTNPYPTYGQGKVHAGVKEHEEGTLEEKYIEIVAGETRTFYDQAVFVKAEAGADVPLNAYANILVPNVVSKGMNFTISVKRNLWYITYNANGGTGAPSTQKKHFNNTLYLSTQKPTKSGYTFTGWSTSSSSSYAQYQPGDAFTTDADTTLYAVWKEKGKPKFTFSKSYDCIPYGIGAVEELVMNATVENPENLKIYYKICFVDDADGTVNDYATNSNGLTNMIETGIASANLTVQPDILIQSIKNCNNEQSFKIVICSNYDNNFDISNTAINKEIISIRLYYNKPIIQSLEVSHAPYNGAQLVGIVKFSDNFISIASSGNGESVYTDNKPMELGGDYSIDNRFDVDGENTLRYVFNFNVNKISDANHTFKLAIDDGFFKTVQTVNLGRLSSDENIYIYQDGTIEANGFLLLDSFKYDNEDVILFEPGGFVSAKSFEKISDGICFCPKVLEAFGHTQRTGD